MVRILCKSSADCVLVESADFSLRSIDKKLTHYEIDLGRLQCLDADGAPGHWLQWRRRRPKIVGSECSQALHLGKEDP